MQKTRRYILEILKGRSASGVDDIVHALRKDYNLSITSVTVRHHLKILCEERYILEPKTQHRVTPGRPQYIYAIAPKAHGLFPNNYSSLIENILTQLTKTLPETTVNVIFEGAANDIANSANISDVSFEDRLDAIVCFLDQHGYDAYYEKNKQGFTLHTRNCPYHYLTTSSDHICQIDMRIIASLLGVTPRKIANITDGDFSCSYLISPEQI